MLNLKRIRILFFSVLLMLPAVLLAKGGYKPEWESLSRHTPVPEWMRDAKFGIYCHWGVYTVPAYGNEQYYYYMHRDSASADFLMGGHRRHEAIWGPLSEFGYHDFIPMFKGENFNADEWAALFKESGARFAGTVAEHHDGFSMWDSRHTPFSAAKMGPRRDVIGELEAAIRARGMKFFASLHHENNYTYIKVKPKWAAYDRKYAKLYGCLMDHDEWLQMWLDKCNEVVDKYCPDIIYFDAWMDLIPENLKLEFLSHYFNKADSLGRDVIVTYKNNDFPRNICMLDHEMANPDKIDPESWLCDYTISAGYHRSWGYVKGMELSSHKAIIHKLIEVVSNNGQLLLNLSPRSDGTFPQDQKDVVANVGVWLWSYGESIYETRPYVVSNEVAFGKAQGASADGYDVYYTKKGNTVYAIFTDYPGRENPVVLTQVNPVNVAKACGIKGCPQVKAATLLSVKKNYLCGTSFDAGGLTLTLPRNARLPSDVAQVVKIEFE